MLKDKRRETEVFSLSFMDCICCGFGAVLLLFILTTGQKVDFTQEQLEDLKARVKQLETQITTERSELERMARPATITEEELADMLQQNATDRQKVTLEKEQLMLLLQQLGILKEAQAKLLAEQENLPKEDEQPVPIPEVDRRQYLTGVKMEGTHVVFLVRTSGSMLGDSLDDAIARLEDPDFKKREAPKWQRVIKSLDWLIANLAPGTNFQVLLFNDETVPLLPNRSGAAEWISRSDRQGVQEALTRLRQVVPQGSANLERAFTTVRYLPTLPDSVVLLTDGLPTTSDSSPNNGNTDDETRMQYLRHAVRQLPPRIPVSTILFPTTGDPGAPALYWELAIDTRGALVSPFLQLARHMIRRRDVAVFSLSFLDCICCGFGAIILLFVLTMGSQSKIIQELRERLTAMMAQQLITLSQFRQERDELQRTQSRASLVVTAEQERDTLKGLLAQLEQQLQYQAAGRQKLITAVEDLRKDIAARQKKPEFALEVPPAPIGLPATSNHVAFIIDSSGSMRDANTERIWPIVLKKFDQVLDAYPEVQGVQFFDADGRYIMGNRTADQKWLPDTRETRSAIKQALYNYDVFSNSNPVPGIVRALRNLLDAENPDMHMTIFILGDEFTGTADAVLKRLDELNPKDKEGKRRVVINAIGFPTAVKMGFSMGNTGVKYANLMRELTYQHGGAFIALQEIDDRER